MERRPTRSGQHGRGRIKDTDYKTRLPEKQRLCAQYNIGETPGAMTAAMTWRRSAPPSHHRAVVMARRPPTGAEPTRGAVPGWS
jgi:hypothetical protein